MRPVLLTRGDLERLRPLCDAGHQEWGGDVYSWAAQRRLWGQILERGGILALEDGRRIVGALAYIHHADERDGQPVVTVVAWYVLPGFRPHGLSLYRDLKRRAAAAGATRVRAGLASAKSTRRLMRLYRRMGYHVSEVVMEKEVA